MPNSPERSIMLRTAGTGAAIMAAGGLALGGLEAAQPSAEQKSVTDSDTSQNIGNLAINSEREATELAEANHSYTEATRSSRYITKHGPLYHKFERLAGCESGHRWHINTGNGYYGGLQFNDPTWDSNGGEKYAKRADNAHKDEQIAIAKKVHKGRGFSPWPACSQKLGL